MKDWNLLTTRIVSTEGVEMITLISKSGSASEERSNNVLSNPIDTSLPGPSVVLSSFEKKSRKRRAAKTTTPERYMQKLEIDEYADIFYDLFIRKKQFNSENSPVVIEIGPHSVSYEDFFNSFKPRGNVDYDTMSIFARVFNDRSRHDALSKPFLRKYMFSAYISEKLLADPSVFDKNSFTAYFNGLLYTTDFDVGILDILHFSSIVSNRWVLMSVNPLYDTVTAFDPSCVLSQQVQIQLMENLATNLKTVCMEFNIACKDFKSFKKLIPKDFPCHSLLHDDGIYMMLYAENWTGKFMKLFTKDVVPNYRKLQAYDLWNCIQNMIPNEYLTKKNWKSYMLRKNKKMKS
ncbi:hypothetical protein ACQ4PT_034508 [Festuca glaucescens]